MNALTTVQSNPSQVQVQQSPSRAVEVYNKIQDPLDWAMKVGEVLAKNGMYGVVGKDAGTTIALQCLMEGITISDFFRTYHLIQGKPSMKADAMLANLRKQQGAKTRVVEASPTRAAIEITFEGETEVYELRWDLIKDSRYPWKNWEEPDIAKRVPKDNWATNMDKQEMLWARLISSTCRKICPEINNGIYTPEETRDYLQSEEYVVDSVVPAEVISTTTERQVEVEIANQQLQEAAVEQAEGQSEEVDASFDATEIESISPEEAVIQPAATEGKTVAEQNLVLQAEVEQLMDAIMAEVAVPPGWKEATLAKRGKSDVGQLTTEECKELIGKMRDKLKEAGSPLA